MKILHTESSMHWGGQEFRTLLEHLYLNNNAHESWLACHPNSQLYKKAMAANAKNIIPITLSRSWRIDISLRLLFICKFKKINLINSHSAKDSLLCLLPYLLGVPLIRSRQITNSIRKKFSYSHCCTHVMAAAEIIKTMLIAAGVNKQKITVIGEGVDLEEFSPSSNSDYLREEFNIQTGEKVVINIGMIRTDKGQKYFLDAAINILKVRNDVKFILIGEATESFKEYANELTKTINQNKITDCFIMAGYRDDVAAFIHLSEFVVISSIGTEAQSRIVPQAFASSKTVVTTNTGGLTELVFDNINGIVVPPKDAESMTHAILTLLNNQALKHKFESAAYTLAISQLSFEQMMRKTITLYSKFI